MVSESTPTPETETAPPRIPRIPRLGAAASGLVALLLVGALFAIPLLGLLIAPLALLPVAHFQAGGAGGVRAWGPMVGLLVVASVTGMAEYALPLLAAYVLLVVLPAVSVEAWARWRWSEGRWVVVTVIVATILVLVGVAVLAAPLNPMAAVSGWLRTEAANASEVYAAFGVAEGEVELALDAAERMASWVLPSLPVAYLVMVLFWVRPRLALLGYPMASGAFEDYRNDEWLAAVFAVTGIGTLVLQGTARWAALNLLVVVLILYFVQGLAIIRAHLVRWIGRGWLVRWGVVLLSLQVPMPLFVAALGVADSFHSLRPRVDEDGGTE
jgi:hypothetical protein